MKKTIFTVFAVTLLIMNFVSQGQENEKEKELMKKFFQAYNQKKFDLALQVVEQGIKDYGETQNLLEAKFYTFFGMSKFADALIVAEVQIKKFGETQNTLGQKFQALLMLEKYNEALETALKKEKASLRKTPWDCLDIASIYIILENKGKTFEWLDEAVNRGFITYQSLYGEQFKAIQSEEKFKKIVARIKDKIGIGKPAQDFTTDLLSGSTFTLSAQKGKVILIDFWAIWCGPCLAEMPNLKKYYKEFKEKGFEIIGISLDNSKDMLEEYIKKENLEWNISFSGKGWEDSTGELYGVKSIPSYWLVDKAGVLRHFGLRGEQLKKAIEELISE